MDGRNDDDGSSGGGDDAQMALQAVTRKDAMLCFPDIANQ